MLEAVEIGKLLSNYNMLKAYLENLNRAIDYEKLRPKDEIISAMTLSQSVSGMPFPPVGTVSNKTADIAQSYSHFAEKEIKAMEQESRLIENILSQLDCAINSLNKTTGAMVYERYIKGTRCKDLVTFWGVKTEQRSERTIKRLTKDALAKISKTVTISKADYNYVVTQEHLRL